MSAARPVLPPWLLSTETGGWWQAMITARSPALRAGASRCSSERRKSSCVSPASTGYMPPWEEITPGPSSTFV